MFVVDTNILVYGADKDSPDHARCRTLLEQWRAQTTPWYVTWGIVYEFLRVVTHPRVLTRPLSPADTWRFLDALFAAPQLRVLTETDRHRHVAAEVFADVPDITGNLVFDAHTVTLMRENGIKVIYTRDTDFNRFPFLDTIDPVTMNRRTSRSPCPTVTDALPPPAFQLATPPPGPATLRIKEASSGRAVRKNRPCGRVSSEDDPADSR